MGLLIYLWRRSYVAHGHTGMKRKYVVKEVNKCFVCIWTETLDNVLRKSFFTTKCSLETDVRFLYIFLLFLKKKKTLLIEIRMVLSLWSNIDRSCNVLKMKRLFKSIFLFFLNIYYVFICFCKTRKQKILDHLINVLTN